MTIGDTYYSADLHLGHERIIELCGRPFGSVQEMNRVLIERINDTVKRKDTLILLGDIVLGKFDETVQLLTQIQAKRIRIIPGNHDRFSLAYQHRGSPETVRLKRRLWLQRYQEASPAIRALADKAPSQWETMIGARPVALSHYPYVGDSHKDVERFGWLRPVDRGLPLLHGHVHGRWRVGMAGGEPRMLNVGVDVNKFAPVSEATVVDWLMDLPMGAARV